MIASAEILRLLGHTVPRTPKWYDGKTREEMEELIRERLRGMSGLPFDPETARIDLPDTIADE